MKLIYSILAFVGLGGAATVGCLGVTGKLGSENPAAAQSKDTGKQPPPPPPVDGSVLPFPPTPSASTAGLTMQDSVYKKRVEPKRLADDAPNILVILIDDAGPGAPSTYGGEINTPTLSRVSQAATSYPYS